MIFNYVVNNHFDNEDHWVCFTHWFGAFLYAVRIKGKVVRMNKSRYKGRDWK